MLSDKAKTQIQHMRRFRRHSSDHRVAVRNISNLILSGDIKHPDDAREFCAEEKWTEDEIGTLSRTIDDVGYTLEATEQISKW